MGSSESKSSLTDDKLEEFVELTYLTRVEIVTLFQKFKLINETEINNDIEYRVNFSCVQQFFPELKHNPFADRLCHVFSSRRDNRFSFEDVLDLFSALSKNCPPPVKALWAFRIFDFDDDMQICRDNICEAIERLAIHKDARNHIFKTEQLHIANLLLDSMDLQHIGNIGELEFQHAIGKIPDFAYSFSLTV